MKLINQSTLIMTESCPSQSFYPLTVSTLDQLYQADLSPSELRLWLYLSALDPWGDRYEELPDTLELMEKVGIKKSTFYAAIAKFQELNLFDFQVRGITFRNLLGAEKVWKGFQASGKVSKNLESIPNSWNSVQEFGTNSSDSENQPLEPLQGKGSSSPQTNQTIQTNSHSQEGSESVKNDFQNEPKKEAIAKEVNKDSSKKISASSLQKQDPFFNQKLTPTETSWHWLPDGPWKTEEGKLDSAFQTAIAQRWVKTHGGDIHEKRTNVLKHFRNELTNLPIEWEWYQNLTLHKASNIQIRKESGVDTTAEEQEIVKHRRAGTSLPEELRVTEERSPAEVLQEVAPHTSKALGAPSDEKFGQINPGAYAYRELPAEEREFWQKVATSPQTVGERVPADGMEAARGVIQNLRQKKETRQGRRLISFAEMTQPEESLSFAQVLADMRKYLNSGSDVCRQVAIDWASDRVNGCELVRVDGRVADIQEIEF